jgi:hypothetical protein
MQWIKGENTSIKGKLLILAFALYIGLTICKKKDIKHWGGGIGVMFSLLFILPSVTHFSSPSESLFSNSQYATKNDPRITWLQETHTYINTAN